MIEYLSLFELFQRLFETSKRYGTEVQGPVRSINQWIDMSKRQVLLDDGSYGVTCPAAMGYRYAILRINLDLVKLGEPTNII